MYYNIPFRMPGLLIVFFSAAVESPPVKRDAAHRGGVLLCLNEQDVLWLTSKPLPL